MDNETKTEKAYYEVMIKKCDKALKEIEKTKEVIHETAVTAQTIHRNFVVEAFFKMSLAGVLSEAYSCFYNCDAFNNIQEYVKKKSNTGICMVAYKELTVYEKRWLEDKDYFQKQLWLIDKLEQAKEETEKEA